MAAPEEEETPLEEKKSESELQGTESDGPRESGQGTESDGQRKESGQGAESDEQRKESGQGAESDGQRKESGQGAESEGQRKESGQRAESDGQRKESGQGAESDGQRKESGQGAESEEASDKRSGVECRERLTVFARDPDIVKEQLLMLFSSNPAFTSGSVCRIFQVEEDKWKSEVDGSSVIVLHLSHSPETPLLDLSDVKEFLDYCRVKHDPENIKVVITDVEEIHLERKIIDEWMEDKNRDWELLTLNKAEMRSLIEHEINPLSVERRMANKLRHIHQIIQEAAEKKHQQALQEAAEKVKSLSAVNRLFQSARNLEFQVSGIYKSLSAVKQRFWVSEKVKSGSAGNRKSQTAKKDEPGVPGKVESRVPGKVESRTAEQDESRTAEKVESGCRVGIFSRTAIFDYSWIRDLLLSDHFRDHVSDVRHYDIRDSAECSFGILYFTKKKEQINEIEVTDVQQIQHFRNRLGKDNVIIVMDDVEDSSDQKKTRILESHPDIKDLYHNLFLFSPQEKSSEYKTLLSSLLNINKPPQPQAEEAGPVEGPAGNGITEKTDETSKKPEDPPGNDGAGNTNKISAEDKKPGDPPGNDGAGNTNKISAEDKKPEDATENDNIVTTDGAPKKDKTPEGAPGNDDIVTTNGASKNDKTHEGAPGNDDIVTTDGASNKDKTPEASFKGNMDKIRMIMEGTRPLNLFLRKPHTVGIFSRSSESDYEWLIKQLKSEPFHYIVSTANPYYISNNGMRKFRDDVSRCTFGILYHTKNRGRINIVDVTDSLYDEELNYMSQHLGKEKVIVVVDDLEDASDGEKTRILENQPSIGKLASGLFLFNANDKKKPMTTDQITKK